MFLSGLRILILERYFRYGRRMEAQVLGFSVLKLLELLSIYARFQDLAIVCSDPPICHFCVLILRCVSEEE